MSDTETPPEPQKPASKSAKQQQLDDETSYACHLLSRRIHKHEIIGLLKHRYRVSTRTCETIIMRAREVLAQRYGKSRKEHRADSYHFYVSVMRDPEATIGERMFAQQSIDRLLGLNAPLEHRHGGSDEAGPIQVTEVIVTTRVEAQAFLALRREKQEQRRQLNGDGPQLLN